MPQSGMRPGGTGTQTPEHTGHTADLGTHGGRGAQQNQRPGERALFGAAFDAAERVRVALPRRGLFAGVRRWRDTKRGPIGFSSPCKNSGAAPCGFAAERKLAPTQIRAKTKRVQTHRRSGAMRRRRRMLRHNEAAEPRGRRSALVHRRRDHPTIITPRSSPRPLHATLGLPGARPCGSGAVQARRASRQARP